MMLLAVSRKKHVATQSQTSKIQGQNDQLREACIAWRLLFWSVEHFNAPIQNENLPFSTYTSRKSPAAIEKLELTGKSEGLTSGNSIYCVWSPFLKLLQ